MEKTIVIDGKNVKFKSTGAIPMRYKSQFGRDLFQDLFKMHDVANLKGKKKVTLEDIEKVDFETLYNIIWTLAKTADKSIPEPLDWLDSFEEFPIYEILDETMDMIESTIQAKKK